MPKRKKITTHKSDCCDKGEKYLEAKKGKPFQIRIGETYIVEPIERCPWCGKKLNHRHVVKCDQCGIEFVAKQATARFCCHTCQTRWFRARGGK